MSTTQTKDPFPAEIVNLNFQKLLDKFHALIKDEPSVSKVKEDLDKLKEEAVNAFLTFNQKDAIIARCDNYINGVYGSTSKEREVKVRTK